jgi:tetratricopeptide (TPR) repeat protein
MLRPHAHALAFAVVLGCVAAQATEKAEEWLEVRSPHFIVLSNGGEKQTRRVALQFERIRAVFASTFPSARVSPGQPVIILLAKDEKTLRTLLPGFWEKKGQVHPAGLFVGGPEVQYVALRLDVTGLNPYEPVYHEFVHLLASRTLTRLPLWLSEGLAEFYGSSLFHEKETYLGAPSEVNLRVLRESRLLPLEVLFAVDHASPYYNEEQKVTIFYAQSWALTHYLMMNDLNKRAKRLTEYLSLLSQEVEPLEAARRTMGDFRRLEQALQAYIGQYSFSAAKVPPPAKMDENQFVVRPVSAAESAAVRGDFLVHTRRPVEARALLEEALKLDSSSAPAHASLGFLCFQEGKDEEAAKWFGRAVELDSRSYLTHFYHAQLQARAAAEDGGAPDVEMSLQRCLELNPDFAPAYATLAASYARRGVKLEEALRLARRAVELEPGNISFYVTLGWVILRTEHVEDAISIAQGGLATARAPEDCAYAQNLLDQARKYRDYLQQERRREEEVRAEEEAHRRRLEEEARRLREIAKEEAVTTTEAPTATPPARPATRVKIGWTAGTVVAVSCKMPPALELTLRGTLSTLRLRAGNVSQIEILGAQRMTPELFDPCKNLFGRDAAISYRTLDASPFDGEITAIEIRR